MDVIIVSRCGVLETPILVKNNTTAEAVFYDMIMNHEHGDDLKEITKNCSTDYGQMLIEVNRYLKPLGEEIEWFTDIEVNGHKN